MLVYTVVLSLITETLVKELMLIAWLRSLSAPLSSPPVAMAASAAVMPMAMSCADVRPVRPPVSPIMPCVAPAADVRPWDTSPVAPPPKALPTRWLKPVGEAAPDWPDVGARRLVVT